MSGAESAGPFSHSSRVALIERYFGTRHVVPNDAWRDVYRLLLWADSTTGLAHCYESDKAQPGRPWYARSLAFHAWLAMQLGVPALELADELDWMFRQVIKRVADDESRRRAALADKADAQLAEYLYPMPVPDDDPELRQIVDPLLIDGPQRPTDDMIRYVLRRLRTHIASENKRKNLLGRGFEDVLAGVIERLDGANLLSFGTQTSIQEIPGFRAPRDGDKDEKVDLYVVTPSGRRILVTAKWSVRADREKQMLGDLRTYIDCESRREPFEYVWITNEFDPARLVANATNTEGRRWLFDTVVHVCPPALKVVHELDRNQLPRTPAKLKELLEARRIVGLGEWLESLSR
jgi:hypothetical protein